ncbi:metallophosphoesterase family protein [Arenimonas terrae]|uniref:Metallophosphoesterase n=1 Tax=Arenimonas terrae TaxID=2546226 RepID=A0A5C4RVD8_9GAMM|nr:metallophosphoesterase [Arenimonas terrae]TNJ35130.1 metallophosphoesterase [Arenimonas terrae]
MIRLLQVSDPHFGTERPEVLEALERMARTRPPDVLVLSGDVTQRARRRQFEAARDFCERLAVPSRLVIPGNHDIPLYDVVTRLLAPYRGFVAAFGPDMEPELDMPGLRVVTVNTTRPGRHKDGEVSPAQIASVSARLRAAQPEQLRVVVTHQPVDVPAVHEEHNLLRRHADAVAAWVAAGADVLMGGHIHWPFVRPLSLRFPALGRRAWCVQAGTAVSRRVRDGHPNSVNVLEYTRGDAEARVQRWDFDAPHGFVCARESVLALDRGSGAVASAEIP